MVDVSSRQLYLKSQWFGLVFDGFLKVNPFALNDNKLPDFKAQEVLDFVSSNLRISRNYAAAKIQ